ncbi:MAG: YidC/Oxa1 family membrane protein insertase, partial [Alphaproteobacteria bacterium]
GGRDHQRRDLGHQPVADGQQVLPTWLFFTYLLHSFPAGLVIYWTWNNILSVAQQWYIMRRHGVEVNLLENMGIPKLIGAIRKGGPAE